MRPTTPLLLLALVACGSKDANTPKPGACDAVTVFADADGDGFGADATASEHCEVPAGHTSRAGDCDDKDEAIHPDADEVCDGTDNNCDGETDEGTAVDAKMWFIDDDGDGFGARKGSLTACDAPRGHVDNAGDCNDGDRTIHPWTYDEPGDNVDMNCDGVDYCVDFTCDGRPDLFIASVTAATSPVLAGTATGFDATTPWASLTPAAPPQAVASADLDNDGFLDIFTTEYSGDLDEHTIFWGSANGFTDSTSFFAYRTRDLVLEDLDGDGFLDLVTATYYGTYSANVFYNDGDRSFTPVLIDQDYAYVIDAGDIDADGHVDVVVGSWSPPQVIGVFKGAANQSPALNVTLAAAARNTDVDLVDLDGDGDLDLINATYGNDASVFLWDGGYSSAAATIAAGRAENVATADFNEDGKLDLVYSAYEGGTAPVVIWNSTDGWQGTPLDLTTATHVMHVIAEDINGDGHADIVFACDGDGEFTNSLVYWGDGQGNFARSTKLATRGAANVRAHDLDQNGYLDLLFTVTSDDSGATATFSTIFYQDAEGFGDGVDIATDGAVGLLAGEARRSQRE